MEDLPKDPRPPSYRTYLFFYVFTVWSDQVGLGGAQLLWERVMKAFKSVLSLIILGLIMPAVWAAEEAIIEDLQTDVTVTKSKADKNTQNIKSLMGGLPALEARVAALEGVSPVADLTGTTYCLFGQGSWLSVAEGLSAKVTFNPFLYRVDFTSPTEFSASSMYDIYTRVLIPDYTIVVEDQHSDDRAFGTYTVVGNLLTTFSDDNGDPQIHSHLMTPDGQVFISGFGVQAGDDRWETGIEIGVRAANCDGLTP